MLHQKTDRKRQKTLKVQNFRVLLRKNILLLSLPFYRKSFCTLKLKNINLIFVTNFFYQNVLIWLVHLSFLSSTSLRTSVNLMVYCF